MICPLSVKQLWWIWVRWLHETTRTNNITTSGNSCKNHVHILSNILWIYISIEKTEISICSIENMLYATFPNISFDKNIPFVGVQWAWFVVISSANCCICLLNSFITASWTQHWKYSKRKQCHCRLRQCHCRLWCITWSQLNAENH